MLKVTQVLDENKSTVCGLSYVEDLQGVPVFNQENKQNSILYHSPF